MKTLIQVACWVFAISGCKYEPAETPGASIESTPQHLSSSSEDPSGDQISEIARFELAACGDECQCSAARNTYNDSGVTLAGEAQGNGECSNAGQNQDCAHGRDTQALNKTGEGSASFDFSKVSDTGEWLAPSAEDWACVIDHHTGLMWEAKQPAGSNESRDASDTYSWYSDAHIDYSSPNNGQCNPQEGCDTQAYITHINRLALCGHSDWRLPSKIELQDLVHYGQVQPSIDTGYFPHTGVGFYWSADIDTDDVKSVWAVGFNYGRVAGSVSEQPKFVRLVRDNARRTLSMPEQTEAELDLQARMEVAARQRCNLNASLSSPANRYRQFAPGEVFDTFTGLIWQQCVAGMSGERCESGQPNSMSWFDALSHAEQQPGGWRLPNIKELQTNIALQCEEPALNPFVFPNMPLAHTWSATPHVKDTSKSYYYQYQNSIIFYGERQASHLVHLVRDCHQEAL